MPPSRTFWALLVAAGLSLSGCVEQRQAAATIAPSPMTARPSALSPAVAPGPRIIPKTAVVGRTLHLDFISEVNPDCSSHGTPTVRVTGQPAHGVVAIVPREDYVTFPATNPRSACNKTKVPGVAADYTPAAGFTGSDLVTLDFIYTGGLERTAQFVITVK